MVFVTTLILGFFFVFLAHSSLLFFLIEDRRNSELPLGRLVFPWPGKGKFVAILALLASLPFFSMNVSAFPATAEQWRELMHRLPALLHPFADWRC